MFGWRKRSEGFEWHEYVRTTILVRRANRQKRIDDARLAAIARVKEARDRGVEAGQQHLDHAKDRAASAATSGWTLLVALCQAAGARIANAISSIIELVRQLFRSIPADKFAVPKGAQDFASLSALYLSDLPRRWRKLKPNLVPLAAFVAAIFGFGALLSPEESHLKAGKVSKVTSVAVEGRSTATGTQDRDPVLSGHATVASGDSLRLNKRHIRLAGIEAPLAGQSCGTANGRKFDCATAAESALSRLIRRQKLSCELSGVMANGAEIGNCRAEETDIARELVRGGYVFAKDGDGASYSGDEEIARTEHAGIWQGPNERPSVWRTRIWEEAKKAAPEGCPIKGLVRGSGRIYSMPWSSGYDARRVREVKGERWFCSEDEAQAAGFRLADGL